MKALVPLVVSFLGTSCVVPPSCIPHTFGLPASRAESFATVLVYAQPVAAPPEGSATGVGMGQRFERGAAMRIAAGGGMAVSGLDMWPQRCPRISPQELARVSRSWQPVLGRMATPHTNLLRTADPRTLAEGWHPDGPLLSLTFGSTAGRSLQLLWDGRSSLPEDLEAAVLETLELVCSHSRLAKGYLLRDLPRQVAGRLECRRKENGP